MQAALSATPAVLTVELEPEAIANQPPPPPLTRDNAEFLAARVGDDLRRILGDEISDGGLILLGALYDLTEILRPGLPMGEALLDIYRGGLRGGAFESQLIALGTAGGRFPVRALAPRRMPGSGPLLAVPFALVAPGPTLERIRHRLEDELLAKGRGSLETDRLVRQLFGITPVNLSYATVNDVSALLRVQLEHAGFGELWRLLEAALYRPDAVEVVDTPAGNRFLTHLGQAWTPALDFDTWAGTQPRVDTGDYVARQKIQRQFVAGLAAHGVAVTHVAPRGGVFSANGEVALSVAQAAALDPDDRLSVAVTGVPEVDTAAAVTLTEQASPELGPIAYTVLAQRGDGSVAYLGHDYPLVPEAITAIRDHWQRLANRLGASFRVERPGRLLVSGDPPRLMPWLDYPGQQH